jgi:ATP phosphoribosyltransferase regulatory subunit
MSSGLFLPGKIAVLTAIPNHMSAWVLPDHIADVLPSEARHIEELRRDLLDTARCYGYELVMPPLLEHLESLLSGAGVALDLQTFKLVDQLSGRTLGLRADATPQVARIDAHLLNRKGVTRLCYCGPVLHTLPNAPHASREPLQLGAEIYGHTGIEADVEILTLALDCLSAAKCPSPSVDLADARLVKALVSEVPVSRSQRDHLFAALAAKDAAELRTLGRNLPTAVRQGFLTLVQLYGDQSVLIDAEKSLPPLPGIRESLLNLKHIAAQLEGVSVTFDLGGSARVRLLHRCTLSRSMPPTAVAHWRAAAATTRSVRCLGAIGRRPVLAWISRRWWRRYHPVPCRRPSVRLGEMTTHSDRW